jgi:hypothetical protein
LVKTKGGLVKKNLIITIAILAISGLALSGCCGRLAREAYEEMEEVSTTSAADFAGTYTVQGEGYTATLDISKTGKGYHLRWVMADGSIHYGKGLVVNDVLGAFYSNLDGSAAGVVAYKESEEGITGLWVPAAGEELFYEKTSGTATLRASSRDLEGEYTITGTNPDLSSYEGQLSILKTGEAWAARWMTGGEVYGTGLTIDDVLILAYGNEAGAGVAVYEIEGSRLDGIWTFVEYTQMSSKASISTGTEKAKK